MKALISTTEISNVTWVASWVDCPDDCEQDLWYYKDGAVYIKPKDAPQPE